MQYICTASIPPHLNSLCRVALKFNSKPVPTMYTHESALKTLFNLRDSLVMQTTQITELQTQATTKGLALYNLGEFTQSQPYLTIGATVGNRDAQYALGEVFRRRANGLTDDAKKWYGLAAAQKHVYALMRLGDADSLKKARELAQAEADKGNADAMLELYELDQNIATLKKAADAGSMEAQYILAIKYDADKNLITDSIEREAAIDALLKKAAEGGLSRAITWYANRPPSIGICLSGVNGWKNVYSSMMSMRC
ncbi:hypothetical protein PMI29_00609 [Pseudomonas sp. GM49]|nr:hypothetical protein PMI29_00609 [Pseudomonas sp. GM49]